MVEKDIDFEDDFEKAIERENLQFEMISRTFEKICKIEKHLGLEGKE